MVINNIEFNVQPFKSLFFGENDDDEPAEGYYPSLRQTGVVSHCPVALWKEDIHQGLSRLPQGWFQTENNFLVAVSPLILGGECA